VVTLWVGITVVAAAAAAAVGALLAKEAKRRRLKRKRQAELQRRVEAAPLRVTMPTKDNRNTYVTVRPTTGDQLPRHVLDELEEYVANLNAKDIRRKLKVEYRDETWQKREH